MFPNRDALTKVPAKAVLAIALIAIVPMIFKALATDDPTESTFESAAFGKVSVYADDPEPDSVVLFVSDRAGWSGVVVDMARQLSSWGALVGGIDGRAVLATLQRRDACTNPAADLETLSRDLQRHAGVTVPHAPLLVGYGTGATLVYAAAAQAQDGAFGAVTSLGFCPRLPVDTSLCEGAGLHQAPAVGHVGVMLEPRADLPMPWILLHGTDDAACPIADARAFAGRIPAAKVVAMPKVTHTFAQQNDWLEQFRDGYFKLATATTEAKELPEELSDLPLVEVPATAGDSRRLAVLLTGAGGWAGLDRGLSDQLAASGVPVVALSTLRYFWSEQQPADVARDLERIMDHYLAAWHKDQVVLIGYSFGANVLPFIVADLSPTYRARVASLNLLGLATHTSFEIHVADWIPGSEPEGAPIAPEFDKLAGIRTLCIYGAEETDSLCPLLHATAVSVVEMPGDHHFNDDATALVQHVIDFVGP